jgi:hypothetical protein
VAVRPRPAAGGAARVPDRAGAGGRDRPGRLSAVPDRCGGGDRASGRRYGLPSITSRPRAVSASTWSGCSA